MGRLQNLVVLGEELSWDFEAGFLGFLDEEVEFGVEPEPGVHVAGYVDDIHAINIPFDPVRHIDRSILHRLGIGVVGRRGVRGVVGGHCGRQCVEHGFVDERELNRLV